MPTRRVRITTLLTANCSLVTAHNNTALFYPHGYWHHRRLCFDGRPKLLTDNGNSVFIRLKTDLSLISVMSKIAGELKDRSDKGRFICYFETYKDLHSWTYEELRSIIGKNK